MTTFLNRDSAATMATSTDLLAHPMEPQYAYRVTLVLAGVVEKMANTSVSSNSISTVFDANTPPKIGVQQYLERIFKYTMCSGECYVLALIYIDRFRKSAMQLTPYNIHRVLITSVMLAAKFFEDAYYNNAYFAQVGGVPTVEINQMELDFLFYVSFRLYVPMHEFQSYRTLFHGRIVAAERPAANPAAPMAKVPSARDAWQNQPADSHAVSTPTPVRSNVSTPRSDSHEKDGASYHRSQEHNAAIAGSALMAAAATVPKRTEQGYQQPQMPNMGTWHQQGAVLNHIVKPAHFSQGHGQQHYDHANMSAHTSNPNEKDGAPFHPSQNHNAKPLQPHFQQDWRATCPWQQQQGHFAKNNADQTVYSHGFDQQRLEPFGRNSNPAIFHREMSVHHGVGSQSQLVTQQSWPAPETQELHGSRPEFYNYDQVGGMLSQESHFPHGVQDYSNNTDGHGHNDRVEEVPPRDSQVMHGEFHNVMRTKESHFSHDVPDAVNSHSGIGQMPNPGYQISCGVQDTAANNVHGQQEHVDGASHSVSTPVANNMQSDYFQEQDTEMCGGEPSTQKAFVGGVNMAVNGIHSQMEIPQRQQHIYQQALSQSVNRTVWEE